MLPEVAEALVWVNGERGATVDARDRGLAFGDGVFESMRYGAAGVFLLEYHLARLQQGARQLKLSLDLALFFEAGYQAAGPLRFADAGTQKWGGAVVLSGIGLRF